MLFLSLDRVERNNTESNEAAGNTPSNAGGLQAGESGSSSSTHIASDDVS